MRRAFTLIELLVVIAIIAILAAILFPVFAQAKNAANKTASMSNVRQTGVAAQLYLADHDDMFFPATEVGTRAESLGSEYGSACFGPGPDATCRFGYPLLVQTYVKNTQLFLCPNDTADDPLLGGRFDKSNPIYWYVYGQYPSYGMNLDYLNTVILGAAGPERIGKSASSIANSASTVMFAEATAKDFTSPGRPVIKNPVGYYQILPPSGGHSYTGLVNGQYAWANFTAPDDARAHGQIWGRFDKKMALVAWVDGHVKYTALGQLNPGGGSTEELDRYFNGTAE